MRFRPCIDIHNGAVKQIVGSSIRDDEKAAGKESVTDNFVSDKDAAYYAGLYKKLGLYGGHIAILNKSGTPEYEAGRKEAQKALNAFRGGMQAGGGVNAENADFFIKAGASHVIVTSYVFRDGKIDYKRLDKLKAAVGRKHLVLDLSCRRKTGDKSGQYYIVTDRWQKFTDEPLSEELIHKLSAYADEFLIHAVDVEGKASGVERELVSMLSGAGDIPITYAGGVGSYEDIEVIRELGDGHIDITIGSALDLFGGKLNFNRVLSMMD